MQKFGQLNDQTLKLSDKNINSLMVKQRHSALALTAFLLSCNHLAKGYLTVFQMH